MRMALSFRKLLVSVVVAAMTMALIPCAVANATVAINVKLNITTLASVGGAMIPNTAGGTAKIDKTVVYPGDTITVKYTPNSNYSLNTICFGNGDVNRQEGLENTFTVPSDYYEDELVVDVVFKASSYIATVPLEF